MPNETRSELLASMLGELERVALALALAEQWSVSVEIAGELVQLVRRRPDRHLVISLGNSEGAEGAPPPLALAS